MDQIVEERRSITTAPARKTRRRFPWGTMIVLFLMAGGGTWVWQHWAQLHPQHEARRGRGGADQPQTVGVATVGTGDIPVTYDGLGTVTSLATVTVKTQINGQLTQVAYKEGQLVHKGDFLAEIDPRPYQVALEQAQGALTRDQAALANAQVDLARYQKLNSQDSIARQQLDTQRALVQQDEGTIATDQGQIDTAKLNLVYCHIVSPVDGRVGLRLVDAGNYVQTSDASGLVVITQLQPISVIFTQPEDRIPAIAKQLKDGKTLEVSVYDRAGAHLLAKGSVETVDNQIDTTTGTVKLRATFPNDDLALFPNQFVNAKLLVDTVKDATVVPSAAVQIGAPGPYAYVVNGDDTVSVRQLKLGPAAGDKTAVLDGLKPGDRVVVDGLDRLHDGAKVRIPGENGSSGEGGDGQGEHHHRGGQGDADTAGSNGDNGDGGHRHGHRRGGDQQSDAGAPAATASQPGGDASGSDASADGGHRHGGHHGHGHGHAQDGSGTPGEGEASQPGGDAAKAPSAAPAAASTK